MEALRLRRCLGWVLAACIASGVGLPVASAQQPRQAPSAEAVKEAADRYDRGRKFYKDGDYKLALIEFRRAYDLAPTFKVLYNIGQVNFQLNNYADAQRAFEQYLKEGGTQVPGARRTEVEKALADLKARTAYVTVKANVDGATVTIDGRSVGTTPLGSKLLIDAGEHRVIAAKDGYSNGERTTSLAGGDDVAVELSLTEAATPSAVPPPTPPIASAPPPPPASTHPAPAPDVTQPAARQPVWGGWVATTTLGLAAVGFGVATLVSAHDLDDKKSSNPPTSPEDLRSAADRTRALSVTTDVCIGAAVLAAAVTIVITLTRPSAASGRAKAARRQGEGAVFGASF